MRYLIVVGRAWLSLFLLAPFAARGEMPSEEQGSRADDTRINPSRWRPSALGVAYLGELVTHPGLALSAELHPAVSQHFTWVVAGEIGGYIHPRNHVGAFLSARTGPRLTAGSGLSGSLLAGVGYLHTWAAGTVYARSADGSVGPTSDSGRPHLMPVLGLDVGWDLRRRSGVPLRPFLRLEAFGEFPFSHALLPHVAAQVGITWFFSGR